MKSNFAYPYCRELSKFKFRRKTYRASKKASTANVQRKFWTEVIPRSQERTQERTQALSITEHHSRVRVWCGNRGGQDWTCSGLVYTLCALQRFFSLLLLTPSFLFLFSSSLICPQEKSELDDRITVSACHCKYKRGENFASYQFTLRWLQSQVQFSFLLFLNKVQLWLYAAFQVWSYMRKSLSFPWLIKQRSIPQNSKSHELIFPLGREKKLICKSAGSWVCFAAQKPRISENNSQIGLICNYLLAHTSKLTFFLGKHGLFIELVFTHLPQELLKTHPRFCFKSRWFDDMVWLKKIGSPTIYKMFSTSLKSLFLVFV